MTLHTKEPFINYVKRGWWLFLIAFVHGINNTEGYTTGETLLSMGVGFLIILGIIYLFWLFKK